MSFSAMAILPNDSSFMKQSMLASIALFLYWQLDLYYHDHSSKLRWAFLWPILGLVLIFLIMGVIDQRLIQFHPGPFQLDIFIFGLIVGTITLGIKAIDKKIISFFSVYQGPSALLFISIYLISFYFFTVNL